LMCWHSKRTAASTSAGDTPYSKLESEGIEAVMSPPSDPPARGARRPSASWPTTARRQSPPLKTPRPQIPGPSGKCLAVSIAEAKKSHAEAPSRRENCGESADRRAHGRARGIGPQAVSHTSASLRLCAKIYASDAGCGPDLPSRGWKFNICFHGSLGVFGFGPIASCGFIGPSAALPIGKSRLVF
jgi:hypothetical protein